MIHILPKKYDLLQEKSTKKFVGFLFELGTLGLDTIVELYLGFVLVQGPRQHGLAIIFSLVARPQVQIDVDNHPIRKLL